jgi:hypothetical protein
MEEDFLEFIKLLNSHKVEYLVIGGHAVAMYGYPRFTGDIDIWINATETNAQRISKVMQEFGFGSLGLGKEDFLKKDNIIQLGYSPVRIDVMNSISGVEFNDAYPRKKIVAIENTDINFIHIEDLIKNKVSTGRMQDQLDVNKLNEINKRK